MQLSPYLLFNGQCEAAFKVYEKALGDKIKGIMTLNLHQLRNEGKQQRQAMMARDEEESS